MKKEDFKLGEYYYIEYDEGFMLALNKTEIKDNNRIKGPYIYNVTNHSGQYTISTPFFTGRKCRIATHKERCWLDMCIAAEKYIPISRIKGSFYSIWF